MEKDVVVISTHRYDELKKAEELLNKGIKDIRDSLIEKHNIQVEDMLDRLKTKLNEGYNDIVITRDYYDYDCKYWYYRLTVKKKRRKFFTSWLK